MLVRRWASQDLVLAAICVAAITLGLWPTAPTRQMIHCRDVHGNTSSYSLELDDSRLARLRREIIRRQNPPLTPAIVLAKWRQDLAGHYVRRCETISRREKATGEALSAKLPLVQVSFGKAAPSAPAANAELAFWRGIAGKSEAVLASAEAKIAGQLANQGPPPVSLGETFSPPKSHNAWITAALLGMLTSCVFAEWRMRAPAIEIVRVEPQKDDSTSALIRIEIPIQWMKIHQPAAVWVRRLTLASLVITAIGTTIMASGRF